MLFLVLIEGNLVKQDRQCSNTKLQPHYQKRNILLKIFRFSLSDIPLDDTWWLKNDIICPFALLMLKMSIFILLKIIQSLVHEVIQLKLQRSAK